MLKTILTLGQLLVAVVLITFILLQSRGTGLGNIFGGSSESYRSKRGMEKILFLATIVIAALFLIVSIAGALL